MYLREARLADVEPIANLHVRLWRECYSFMPKAVHDARGVGVRRKQWARALTDDAQRIEPAGCLVFGGEICGFWQVKENHDTDIPAYVSHELHSCYLLGQFRGTCAGPKCLQAMARAIVDRGGQSASVWVFRNNPIKHVYRSLGFRPHIERERVIAGCALPELGLIVDDVEKLEARMARYISRFSSSLIESR